MSGIAEQVKFFWNTFVHSYFSSPGPFFTKDAFPDLTGQTWVVTGATGGIGLELAKILVNLNAHVWIVGRSETKIEKALQTLRDLKPLAKVDYTIVDYDDLSTVKPGISKILNGTSRLHGIIHNAGIMTVPKGSKTKQGFEQHLGVNNIATQLVQDLLDPLIVDTTGGRIVWMSSAAHFMAPHNGFNFAKTDSYPPPALYAQSKALNYIQAIQWTRKHPGSEVKAIAVHPGIIKTDITRWTSGIGQTLISPFQYSVDSGIYPPIYAALSPDAKNNEYIVPWGRAGYVRPDIYRAARGEEGVQADRWIEAKLEPFK